jgi:hypothetical protein
VGAFEKILKPGTRALGSFSSSWSGRLSDAPNRWRRLAQSPQRSHDPCEVIPLIRPDETKFDEHLNHAARHFNEKPCQRVRERVASRPYIGGRREPLCPYAQPPALPEDRP